VTNPSGAFLGSRVRLRPASAVAALLQLADGRYVMQLRDSNPGIFYPDHWGCFGGAVDAGEEPVAALVRELAEELAVKIDPPGSSGSRNSPSISDLPATACGIGPIMR
jgi:8-oxo-dGTP pyrophosphatase MutT (NUDIX family)